MNANFFKTLAVLLALIIAPQQGLSFEPRTLDAAQMQRDLRFLQTKLNTIHPEPYHHLNKDQFDAMVNRLDANLAPMSSKEWYVKLADLVSSLHDGHTAVFYNQDERQQYFNEGGTILPFFAEVKDDESVIVGHHFTDDAALSGAEILTINGQSIDEVLRRMRPLTFGESILFRNGQISRSFGRMHWLLYGHTDAVTLSLRQRDGTTRTKSYAMLTEAQYNEFVTRDFPKRDSATEKPMQLSFLEDKPVALLDLNHFETYKGYKDSIAEAFRTVKERQIETLFIDLRGNGGGTHFVAEAILHYLMDTPWALVSKAKIKTSDEWYASLPASARVVRYLPKKPLIRFATLFLTDNARIDRIDTSKDPVTNQPIFELYTRPRQHYSKEYLYSDRIFLLTDRNSYSMSGMFAAIMKDYQRAVIVGEETGGLANPHGSNVTVTLPESKFRFTISTSRAYRPSGIFDNRGVVPDIAVPFDELSRAKTLEQLLELTGKDWPRLGANQARSE